MTFRHQAALMTDSCDSTVKICDNKWQVLEKSHLLMSLVVTASTTSKWRQEFFCGPSRSDNAVPPKMIMIIIIIIMTTIKTIFWLQNWKVQHSYCQFYYLPSSEPIYLRPVLILFSIFLLRLPTGYFRRCFPIKILYTLLLSITLLPFRPTCPVRCTIFNFTILKILSDLCNTKFPVLNQFHGAKTLKHW
jgi:hypothetical protein